jgi:chromosome segregation ATPase
MKQYLRNLCLALCGNNPYQMELADVRGKYEKTAERVTGLQELYFKGVELYDAVSRHVAELEKLVADGKEQEKGLQRLIENLRERVAEKDGVLAQQGKEFRERMERMKADYQRRIDEYTAEIDRLKGETYSVTDHNGQNRDGE